MGNWTSQSPLTASRSNLTSSGYEPKLQSGITDVESVSLTPREGKISSTATPTKISQPISSVPASGTENQCRIKNQTLLSANDSTKKDVITEPIFGVTLSFVHSFIEDNGGRSAFEGKDTTWVCDNIIVQKYKDSDGRSVCKQLRLSKPKVIGMNEEIKWFISHAWKYKFLDVVDALAYTLRQLKEPEDVIIWFDLFFSSSIRKTHSYFV